MRDMTEALEKAKWAQEDDERRQREVLDACKRDLAQQLREKDELLLKQRQEMNISHDEVMRKREEEFRRTCTFQPNLGRKQRKFGNNNRNRNNQSFHQRSQTPRGRSRKSDIKPSGMEECTFKPKVNNVPRKFGSAQLYLQNNVHDRWPCYE